jgi:uncharacterized DUF497 family protein
VARGHLQIDAATSYPIALKERVAVSGRQFQFEWDEVKATNNVRKHGVSFELARTVFHDKNLLTIADVEHSDAEERWFSVGCTSNGRLITVVYPWSDTSPPVTKICLISARKATPAEITYYQESS